MEIVHPGSVGDELLREVKPRVPQKLRKTGSFFGKGNGTPATSGKSRLVKFGVCLA